MIWQRLAPPALLAVAVLIATPFIAGSADMLDTSAVIAIYALMALSVGVSYGSAGILSVAQASFAAMGAYATAILTIRYSLNPWVSWVAAVGIPAVFAYPFARLVTRLSPLALAIATLMFGYVFDIGLREAGDLTGGYIGLSGVPEVPFAENALAFHGLAWGIVVLVAVGYANLSASHIGRALRTIRMDSLRAEADGVNVGHARSTALSLGAAIAGMGGWLYAHHITYIGPDSLEPSMSLSVLLMAVVGGAQTILGPVVGAAALTLVFKFLPSQETVGIFYGSVLILCLLVAPKGILGLQWRRRSRREAR